MNVHFLLVLLLTFYIDEDIHEEPEQDDGLQECKSIVELHRKVVSSAFWNSEVEDELRELGWINFKFENHVEEGVSL